MPNEIVKTDNYQVEQVNKETLSTWLSVVGNTLEPKEQSQFLEIAQAFNLNPFKREIYCTAYGSGQYRQLSIIVGFEVYLKRAELSEQLDGFEVTTTGSTAKNDLKAIIKIYRKDRKFPFIWECAYNEYVQKTKEGAVTKFWKDKPETMIKKVAMSQGFRLCFPVEIGGMPYTADELPDNMTKGIENAEIIPETKTLPDPKKEKTFAEKAKELPLIAEANGISDFAEFAKFIGISKGMPTQTDSVKLFVSDPDIYLEEIKRYHRHIEAGLNKNEDEKLFPETDEDKPGLPF